MPNEGFLPEGHVPGEFQPSKSPLHFGRENALSTVPGQTPMRMVLRMSITFSPQSNIREAFALDEKNLLSTVTRVSRIPLRGSCSVRWRWIRQPLRAKSV